MNQSHQDPQAAPGLHQEAVPVIETVMAEYQETRHGLKNSLAVIMAMAEMAQRNPAHVPRLIECVLEKGPRMSLQLDDFTKILQQLHDGTYE